MMLCWCIEFDILLFFFIILKLITGSENAVQPPDVKIQQTKNNVTFTWTVPTTMSPKWTYIEIYGYDNMDNASLKKDGNRLAANIKSHIVNLDPCRKYEVRLWYVYNETTRSKAARKSFWTTENVYYAKVNTVVNMTWATSLEFYDIKDPGGITISSVLENNRISNRRDTGKYRVYSTDRHIEMSVVNVQKSDGGLYAAVMQEVVKGCCLLFVTDFKFDNIWFSVNNSTVTEAAASYIFNEGQKVEIIADINSDPEPTFVFYSSKLIETRLTYVRKEGSTNYTTNLPDLTCEEAGNFTMEARNTINNINHSAKASLQLVIQCPPKQVRFHRRKIASLLNKVEDVTVFVVSYPAPNVTWTDESGFPWTTGKQHVDNRYMLNSRIKVSILQNYEFQICNSLGCLTENITVLEIGKPDAVVDVTVFGLSHNSASLLWIAGFDGGALQRFYITLGNDEHEVSSENTDAGSVMTYSVNNLVAKTAYSGSIIARNKYGDTVTQYHFETLDDGQSEICSIVSPAVIVFLLLLVGLWMIYQSLWKKRRQPKRVRSGVHSAVIDLDNISLPPPPEEMMKNAFDSNDIENDSQKQDEIESKNIGKDSQKLDNTYMEMYNPDDNAKARETNHCVDAMDLKQPIFNAYLSSHH